MQLPEIVRLRRKASSGRNEQSTQGRAARQSSRKLHQTEFEGGLERTFADITALAQQCRFADCSHLSEPGCAVLAALESGDIDQRRLENYRKIMREQAMNSATLAEKRARDKALGKYYRSVLSESRRRKGTS